MNKLEIYTDGSCSGNGKENAPGGCAFIVLQNGEEIHREGFNSGVTTNQQMELYAAIRACEYVQKAFDTNQKCDVIVYSDSAYLVNCYKQEWYMRWQKNGWLTAQRTPVANKSYWERLIPFFMAKNFRFEKVKGHATDKWNNEVDMLAVSMTQKAKEGVIV